MQKATTKLVTLFLAATLLIAPVFALQVRELGWQDLNEQPRRKQRGIKIFKGFYQFLAPQAAGY